MGRLRRVLRKRYNGFFWGFPLLLALLGAEASAEEIPAESKSDTDSEALAGDRFAGLPEIFETTLASGLRVWRAKTEGASIEVCSSHRVRLGSAEERAALGFLVAIVERGGYRASGEDYSALLKSRGLVSHAEVRGEVVLFCTKGPSKELPLALWTARGRFARQALNERELESARSLLRLRAAEAPAPDARALARLRNIALPSYEADLSVPVAEEVKAKVTIDAIRELHDKVFFSSASVVTVLGNFGDAVLDRLVTEHLALPKALSVEPKRGSETQTNYRYGLVEDVRVQKPSVFFGFRQTDFRPEETELGLHVLALDLNAKQKKAKFHVDSGSGPLLVLRANGADLKELEERRKELEERVEKERPLDAATIARALDAKRDGIIREIAARGASELAYRAANGEGPNLGLDAGAERTKFSPENVARSLKDAFRSSRRSTVELVPVGFSDPFLTVPPKTHVVEEGESLGSLAFRFGTTPEALLESIGSDGKVVKGAKITLPKGTKKPTIAAPLKYRVKKGDTLLKIAKANQTSAEEISAHNQLASPDVVVDQILYVTRYLPKKDEVLRVPSKPEAKEKLEAKEETGAKAPENAPKESGPSEKSGALPSVETAPPEKESSEEKPALAPKETAKKTDEGRVEAERGGSAGVKDGANSAAPAPDARSSTGEEAAKSNREAAKPAKPAKAKVFEKPGSRVHVVASGDQLLKIAKKYGVTVSDLCEKNRITRDTKLFVGRKLEIPASRPSKHSEGSSN